jgi:hypothetical protein
MYIKNHKNEMFELEAMLVPDGGYRLSTTNKSGKQVVADVKYRLQENMPWVDAVVQSMADGSVYLYEK